MYNHAAMLKDYIISRLCHKSKTDPPSKRPLHQSYQVYGHLWAGEYPGDKTEEKAKEKLQHLLDFGVRYFIDLTEEGELLPYKQFLPADVEYIRYPVRDVSTPTSIEHARQIVDDIIMYSKGQHGEVYVHCWGGVGRTGTIIACVIAERMEHPQFDTVMTELHRCFAQMPKSADRQAPETTEQEQFIKQYIADVQQRLDKKFLVKDSIRGSLMAGAAGDALGYTVEFWNKQQIHSHYGKDGITQFELASNGKALVSDDTQMTLFTANALLMGITRWAMRGIGADLGTYTDGAYLDWYYTQTGKLRPYQKPEDFHYTWLRDLPELAQQRAPGVTCMNACESLLEHNKPDNSSKGCGGIMRVAPMGLMEAAFEEMEGHPLYADVALAEQGAVIAKMTHRHPLGYYPAALLTILIAKLIPLTPEEAKRDIERIIEKSLDVLSQLDKGEHEDAKKQLADLTVKAMRLAHNSNISDADALWVLGEGWVAEEAWAVSLFCTLRHIDSMHDAIIAAVNHNGDSDSTGSITGNIMGAIYGYEAIKRERLFCPQGRDFEQTIELSNIILALADDIFNGCCISEYSKIDTPEKKQWYARYVDMQPAGIRK